MKLYGFILTGFVLMSGALARAQDVNDECFPQLRSMLSNHSQKKAAWHDSEHSSHKTLKGTITSSKNWTELGKAYASTLSVFDPSLSGNTLDSLITKFQAVESAEDFSQALSQKFKALATAYQNKVNMLNEAANSLSSATTCEEIENALKTYYSQTAN